MELDDEYEIEDAPKFQFVPDGEEYMLATNAAKAFGKSSNELFGLYPSLWRRKMTVYERAHLETLGTYVTPTATIVRAVDVDELLANRTVRDSGASLVPEHHVTPRMDRGYLVTRSVHHLAVPAAEAEARAALRERHKNRPMKKPSNLLRKSFETVRGGIRPGTTKIDYVPILLNVEHGGLRYIDKFLWNASDTSVTPRTFAVQLCMDEELPMSYADEITASIQDQLLQCESLSSVDVGSRLVEIKLSVQLGTTLLTDKFIWNHAETALTPEKFAQQLCTDLGVGGSFIPLVACSIREQLLADRRMALQEDKDDHKPPLEILQLSDCYHIEGEGGADEWTPQLVQQSWSQLERQAKVADREARARKRNRGDDGETRGRRSGRARRDVSYTAKRPVEHTDTDAATAAAAAQTTTAAAADVVAAALDGAAGKEDEVTKLSARVVEHISVRRGVDLIDGRGFGVLAREAVGMSGAYGALRSLREKSGASEIHNASGTDISGDTGEDMTSASAGPYRDIPRGYYRDNYLNRRLGRVGQKKVNYGKNTFRNEFYHPSHNTSRNTKS